MGQGSSGVWTRQGSCASQAQLAQVVRQYVEDSATEMSWVRQSAVVRHAERLTNVYVGAGVVVDHVLELRDSALLSKPPAAAKLQTSVGGGASIVGSTLQWGACVSGGALVTRSLLLEASKVVRLPL